jgi:hypothetical protein
VHGMFMGQDADGRAVGLPLPVHTYFKVIQCLHKMLKSQNLLIINHLEVQFTDKKQILSKQNSEKVQVLMVC